MRKKFTKRGQIWLCDLKVNIGSEQNGVRPCIVLNFPIKNERTCVVIPCSNTIRKHSIKINNYNFQIYQVRAIDQSRLIRLIERFEEKDTDKVRDKLISFLK